MCVFLCKCCQYCKLKYRVWVFVPPLVDCTTADQMLYHHYLCELRPPLVVAVRRAALQQQSQRHAQQQRPPQVPVPQQSRAPLRVQDVDELVPHRPKVPQDGLLHRLVQRGELVVSSGRADGHRDVPLHRDVLGDGDVRQPGERPAGLIGCRHFTAQRSCFYKNGLLFREFRRRQQSPFDLI